VLLLLLRWLHLTLLTLLLLLLLRWLHLTLLTLLLLLLLRWLHLTLLWRARPLWRLFLLFLFCLGRLGDHQHAIDRRGVC